MSGNGEKVGMVEMLAQAEANCERLRALAHAAPMNIYHKNADGHRWVEMVSYAFRDRGNEWLDACLVRDRLRAALSEEG